MLTNRLGDVPITLRQAFFLTTVSWIVVAGFSALPLWFSHLNISYTDAFFEAMSGITTTGATVIQSLDTTSLAILLWRSLLQWLGGIGIIVMAITVFPKLNTGGMQLFRTDSSSEKSDRVLPRTVQLSFAVVSTYLLLTVLCALALWHAGMDGFDAVNHGMTALATGGFSTHDDSLIYYNSARIDYILAFFMIAGGIPFILYIQAMRGKAIELYRDSQVQLYLALIFVCTIVLTLWLCFKENTPLAEAFRYASFTVVSVITTSGFMSVNYAQWGGLATALIFMLCVVGGCTGSTAGGIKIFRFQVLYQTTVAQILHMIQPHAVVRPSFNRKLLSETICSSVLSFLVLYAGVFMVVALILSLCGLDYMGSMSLAASSISNNHLVLGIDTPIAQLPGIIKWALSFSMLLGRLELFTVLVLFTPYFWRD